MTLPKHVIEKIEREADLYSRPFERVPSFQDVAVEKYKAGATVWAERCIKLRETLSECTCNCAFNEGKRLCKRCAAIESFDEDIKK